MGAHHWPYGFLSVVVPYGLMEEGAEYAVGDGSNSSPILADGSGEPALMHRRPESAATAPPVTTGIVVNSGDQRCTRTFCPGPGKPLESAGICWPRVRVKPPTSVTRDVAIRPGRASPRLEPVGPATSLPTLILRRSPALVVAACATTCGNMPSEVSSLEAGNADVADCRCPHGSRCRGPGLSSREPGTWCRGGRGAQRSGGLVRDWGPRSRAPGPAEIDT